MAQTRKPEFEKDQGWETLDQQQLYTPEEYALFERKRQEEVDRLIQEGKVCIIFYMLYIIHNYFKMLPK